MEAIIPYISFAFSIGSVVLSLITFVWTVKRDKKQATFDAFNRLQDEVFDKINHLSKTKVKEIAANPTKSEFTEYSQHLVRVEQFCIGIQSGIYDFNVTKKIASKYLTDVFEKSRPIIEHKRKIYPNESQCVEFEKIVRKMSK